jgi:hypothetical protein
MSVKGPSKAWYLLPTFLSIIGGLIMFFVIKDEDRNIAKKGLILGIILTAVGVVLSFVLFLWLAALGLQMEQQQQQIQARRLDAQVEGHSKWNITEKNTTKHKLF